MRRRHGMRLGFWYRFAVAVLKPIALLLTRRDWRGQENLPLHGGIVVVPNHLSYVDPVVTAHFLYNSGRPPRYLAKEGMFRVPFVGMVLRHAQQIPVYRESRNAPRAMRDAVAAVRAGECVVVYPEATLTRDPDLWPMVGKTGAARIALETGCPVIPLATWGPQRILAPYSTRPNLRRHTVHVAAGPAVDLSPWLGSEPTPAVLRAMTDRILDEVTRLLADLRGELPPAVRFDPRAAGLPTTGNFRRKRSA